MKVRVSMELELPDLTDKEIVSGHAKLQDEYVKGITWEMAFVIQAVFDNLLNFAACHHLQEAMKWMGRHKNMPNAEHIVKHHNEWEDILRAAEKTMKIEKIS